MERLSIRLALFALLVLQVPWVTCVSDCRATSLPVLAVADHHCHTSFHRAAASRPGLEGPTTRAPGTPAGQHDRLGAAAIVSLRSLSGFTPDVPAPAVVGFAVRPRPTPGRGTGEGDARECVSPPTLGTVVLLL